MSSLHDSRTAAPSQSRRHSVDTMHLRAASFFLLINYLVYCWSFGFTPDRDKFDMMLRKLGKILGKCTLARIDHTGVVRHARSYNNWPIEFVSNVSVINLKEYKNYTQFAASVYQDKKKVKQKLRTFIILTHSTSNFVSLMTKLRKTFLWDPLAHYLILDDMTVVYGCQNAFTFLNTSWIEDLLYSTYFCLHPKLGFTMYTYNPYSKRAPDPWEEVHPNRYTFRNHAWTLFRQRVISGTTTCEDFTFDKTTEIDDYPINGLALHTGFKLKINQSRTGVRRLMESDGTIMKIVIGRLKAHLNLTVVWNSTDFYRYHTSVQRGEYDLLLNSQYIHNKPDSVLTYPHASSGLRLMTQKQGYKPQYKRILTHMNPRIIGLIFLVYVGTSLTLWICTRKGLSHASLEAHRLLLGSFLLRSPRKNPLRIFIIVVILLFMLTNTMFQSSLASLLTVPIHNPYIETMDDLRNNPDFRVYTYYRYESVVSEDWLKPRIVLTNTSDCTEYVKRDGKAACAAEQTNLFEAADDENFHLGKKKLATIYIGHVVRPDWPLYERMSYLLSILFQGGIVKYLRDKTYAPFQAKWEEVEREERSTSTFHVMVLSDLMFAFYILLFGLMLSSLVFFLEIFLAKRERPCHPPWEDSF